MQNYREEKILFGNAEFFGSNMGTLFHAASSSMLISDCHFGKAAHFRRHGIPVPALSPLSDHGKICALLEHLQPARLLFLGDLFHSDLNYEWELIQDITARFPETEFILVLGNHDIIPQQVYRDSRIHVMNEYYLTDELLLSHEPVESGEGFNICGHIHPGYHISLGSRQAVMLPCYYIHGKRLVMPAFGNLTGLVNQNKGKAKGKALCYTGNKLFWS